MMPASRRLRTPAPYLHGASTTGDAARSRCNNAWAVRLDATRRPAWTLLEVGNPRSRAAARQNVVCRNRRRATARHKPHHAAASAPNRRHRHPWSGAHAVSNGSPAFRSPVRQAATTGGRHAPRNPRRSGALEAVPSPAGRAGRTGDRSARRSNANSRANAAPTKPRATRAQAPTPGRVRGSSDPACSASPDRSGQGLLTPSVLLLNSRLCIPRAPTRVDERRGHRAAA